MHEIADRLDTRILQAIVGANGKLQLVHRAIQLIVAWQRRSFGLLIAVLFGVFLKVDEDRHVVLDQLCCQTDRVVGFDRTIGPNFDAELVVFRVLAQARRVNCIVDLLDRRVHRIDRNVTKRQVFIEVALGRNIAAAALEAHFDIERAAIAYRRDMQRRIEYFDVGVSLNVTGSHFTTAGLGDRQCLWLVAVQLERYLLQIQDHVGRIFNDAFD